MTEAASQWVFGYGSLIWRPGFAFRQSKPALLEGYHRSLCVISHKYRGTADCHGLVFGLDHGGSCRGVAFEVEGGQWQATLAYLRARELITGVYIETRLPIQLEGSSRTVDATTYVVDPAHEQYTGQLKTQDILGYVRQGHGEAGSCADYVRNTARHLREIGFADEGLEELAHQI